ncbi:hypothetical protein SAMN02745248_01596 [Hathewaya proteolytica DSM 3090]|uniref:ABC-2 family transporter protein n=1 Tax=Hathewaya proteolytica DSM 3090 TaxID=1121331 RepID=A0A1M6P5H6_9CLOT|nr:hypothetical protein [Hathewaya proteolytica]SHK03205.1 hypothetical protein SAMN02745248_01596 [Hathewaya proteolytica DSM 3090]
MKIVINEMKKIFNLKMVCLLIVGSTIFYQRFIAFHIDIFPNGRPEQDEYNIMVQMIKDYGHSMDEIEVKDFKKIHEAKVAKADKFLSTNEEFNQLEVYSYEDYLKKDYMSLTDENYEKLTEVKWKYLDREEGRVFWELQVYSKLIESYEHRDEYLEDLPWGNYNNRINEIINNNENESILSWSVFMNYNNIIIYFAVCIVIGIAFMLTPMFLKDKKAKVDYIQYSSRNGRKLFKDKLMAGFLSTLIITTIELAVCFFLYKGNKTSMFFGSNINSRFNSSFWFDITFGQYIIITFVSIYIISIITAFITMFISSKINHYIVGIGVQVPTLFVIGGVTATILLNQLFSTYIPKYSTTVIYTILIIVAVLITKVSIKKERTKDINS